jgi:hypothetical protein
MIRDKKNIAHKVYVGNAPTIPTSGFRRAIWNKRRLENKPIRQNLAITCQTLILIGLAMVAFGAVLVPRNLNHFADGLGAATESAQHVFAWSDRDDGIER